jgi:DNA-binding IclR family transcriptional regulator
MSRIMKRPGAPRYAIQALDRAVSILHAFDAQQPELTLREIAARSGLHKSTAFRILVTLESHGFIDQNPTSGEYRLGMELFALGQLAVAKLDLLEIVRPFLQRLVERTKESAHLGTLQGGRVLYLDKVEGRHSLLMVSRVGDTAPAHCTSLGKAMLACLEDDEVRRLLSGRAWARRTPRTLRGQEALLADLAATRRRGYAVDDEELNVGVRCVGAALRDYTGAMVGAISIASPSARLPAAGVPALGDLLRRTAAEISGQIGYGRGASFRGGRAAR